MKFIIFMQDTMSSIVVSREILKKNHDKVIAIVRVSQIKKDSLLKQIKITHKLFKKYSKKFFFYKMIDSKLYHILLSLHKFTNNKNSAETVTNLAKKYNIPIIEANNVNDIDFLNKIAELKADFILCHIAQILKKDIFKILGNKLINAHGSYLPEYRGAAQYIWYLINEDKEFGVTIHQMEPGLDTGDIIIQERFPIEQNISAYKLHYDLAKKFGLLFNQFIQISENQINLIKQDHSKATFTGIPTKEDMKLFEEKKQKLFTIKDIWRCI